MRRLAVVAMGIGAALAGLVVQACGAEGGPEPVIASDGGTSMDSQISIPDAGPGSPKVRIVVVNALTRDAVVSDASDKARDVRLCFGKAGQALPDTGTMPLTSYPGIARGRAADLGQVQGGLAVGPLQIDVLDAYAVQTSTSGGACAKLLEPQGGFAHVPSATVTVNLVPGVNLLVLRDRPSGGVAIEQAVLSGALAGPDAGTRPIMGQVGVFSSWLAPDASAVVEVLDDAGARALVSALGAGTVGPSPATTIAFASDDPYEISSLRFRSPGSQPTEVTQTLGSIQFVSDPTTSPATFFDRRATFAFVVVGDPKDTTALADGGRKAGFDGAELHIVAVPYLN